MRPLLLLLAVALTACAEKSATDNDDETSDDTETAADDSETTEDSESADDSDEPADTEAPADTEPVVETPEGLASNWSGTYTVNWNWVERDWSYPGPGERYDTIVDNCALGNVTVEISDEGALSIVGPIGACNAAPVNWTGISITGTVTGADTASPTVTGDVLFGSISGRTGQIAVRTGVPFTAAFSSYDGDPLGQLTLTGGRSFQDGYYGENLSVTVTLRPQ